MYIFVISVFVIMFLFTKIIRKKYNIEPYPKPYMHMNYTHKWGERILILLFIIFFILSYVIEWYLSFGYLLIACILLGYRTLMEYKHDREEKEYIITLIWAIGSCIIFIGLIFSAYSNNENVIQIINNKNSVSTLVIEKIENDTITEEMIVKDKQKTEEILTMIEGLEVEETNYNSFAKEMELQNTYVFSFLKKERMDTEVAPYSFFVLEDGTFIFTHGRINSTLSHPRITIVEHNDLLDEMKQLLKIDF